ncbi:clostri-philic family protein [Clostridium sp. 'White wine YQ']|nr:clostri-philic family protein [Clostridium sp. 'White wine YQ']MDD7795938.1 clostri-philic family protein [Clostridium sp. 'White wine YQ']
MVQRRENNALQKGQRRQKLHNNQDNRGNDKKPAEYENFNGEEIK